MNTLAFDWDGTLIDVWARYYGLYAGSHASAGSPAVEPLPESRYRELVRAGEPHYRILQNWRDPQRYQAFLAYRNERLEQPGQLSLDRCVAGVIPVLERLAGMARLIVVSARDDHAALCAQLDRLGVGALFAAVHATAVYGGAEAKARVLRRERAVAMVGDTEVDLNAASQAGIAAVAVGWGLRSAEVLRQAGGSVICETPSALEQALSALIPARLDPARLDIDR